MPALPGFKQFLTDTSGVYDALVPYDTPIEGFQIGHNIEWEFSLTDGNPADGGPLVDQFATPVLGMGLAYGEGTGVFEYKLKQGDDVYFWQKVALTFNYTALTFGLFGGIGLDLFVWSFKKEVIDTYVVDGDPTDKHPTTPDPNNPAWRYTIGATPFGEQGIAIPGGGPESGNGVGIRGGIISSFWQTPLYLNAGLPAGLGLEIITDGWQAEIARLPLWHIRAIEGVEEIDAIRDHFDLLQKTFARDGSVYFSLAALPRRDEERGLVAKGSEPSVNEDRAGVVYVSHVEAAGVYEYVSRDTGHTFARRRVRANQTTTDLVDLKAWKEGFNMPRFVTLEDGHRGTITYKNGALWFKTSRDNYAGAILVHEVPQQDAYELSVDAKGVYYVSSAGKQEYYSDQGGEVWKPVPARPS